jgi:hypothetical protein
VARRSKPVQVMSEYADADDQGRINVTLSAIVRHNRALMVRLHHNVVDLLDKNGLLDCFTADVEKRLATLGPDIISDFIADLLKEDQPTTKKSKPPNAR